MEDSSIFGSPIRDRILVALALKGESHARELARGFGMTQPVVARAVTQLERDGILVAITHGRTRVLRLNPRWYANEELRAMLERIANARPDLYQPFSQAQTRLRRSKLVGL